MGVKTFFVFALLGVLGAQAQESDVSAPVSAQSSSSGDSLVTAPVLLDTSHAAAPLPESSSSADSVPSALSLSSATTALLEENTGSSSSASMLSLQAEAQKTWADVEAQYDPSQSSEASSSSAGAPVVAHEALFATPSVNSTTGVKSLSSASSALIPEPGLNAISRKRNVAVLEFTGSYKIFTREEIQSITNRFETELMKTDSFTVLERRNMDAILQEQGFQQTGACNSAECQVQVGQLLGVDLIITGDVSKVGDIISLNIKMVDVEKGSNVLGHVIDIKGELQDVLRGGCYEMAQIFSGRKTPEKERSVLTAEKSSVWPWIIGGVAIVGLGVGGTVLYLNMNKDEGKTDEYDIQ